jgi:intracellular sulfur oxidation DsrE/DsrF family protein
MPPRPVVAAPPFQSSCHSLNTSPRWWLFALLSLFLAATTFAQEAPPQEQRYVVDIEVQTAQELGQLLERAEQLLLAGVEVPRGGEAKVTFVLHGPVLKSLLRSNYLENKRLVDLAASLSAMDVIDVKACRAWMKGHGLEEQELQPFVEAVSYGPAVVKSLLAEKNYLYF